MSPVFQRMLKNALEHRLGKAKQIKQGMMQQILTGKVRLVTPQEAEAAA